MHISVVILSFNRREALSHTLTQLSQQAWVNGEDGHGSAQVIVVDNASHDGSAQMVQEKFEWVELHSLERNIILEGFNVGAARARHDLLLILDDDSWPSPGAVEQAAAKLEATPNAGGVMLHRKHPKSGAYEWPFAATQLEGIQHHWPDMGCGNLYKTSAWRDVGGYENGYTLYRNDTDIALKLLNHGYDVLFCRDWLVWHDSYIAARKSDRWLHLSTRNWMWMAKRHAGGLLKLRGQLLGWLHAHRLAGWRPRGQLSVLRGALSGLVTSAPPLPPQRAFSNSHYARLLKLKMTVRG
jgi:GT2 family glycosyltransferase